MKIAEYNQMMAYLTRPEPLPQPKPEELLKIQEQNRLERLRKTMEEIGPGLMDESVDFIERQGFAKKGIVRKPGQVGAVTPMYSNYFPDQIIGYYVDIKEPGTTKRAYQEYFGIKKYGSPQAAKAAAESTYLKVIQSPKFRELQTDRLVVKQEAIVKSFLNYLENNGEFDGYEKLAKELEEFKDPPKKNTPNNYETINKIFKQWKEGKFEVEGVNRKNLSANAKQEIKNWSPKARGERTNIRQKQLQFLDNLNNEDLPLKEVKQAFKKEFGKGKFYNEKTFGQRANQLTQLKKEGSLPSSADGSKTMNYGVEVGERTAWLKKALSESVSFGNNYNRLIRASDVLQTQGKIKEAQRLSDVAKKFFGSNGVLTKLPGQAEHPLSVTYGGIDNLLKVDSLVKGDLNQLKRVVFDNPIKKLTGEYNKSGVTVKRKNEIKNLIQNRKSFMNYLTSGSFDKGIVEKVNFNFTPDKVTATADVTPIDKLGKNYDFGKFVQKGEEYSKIFKEKGKDLNLITKGGFAKRTAISDKNILKLIQSIGCPDAVKKADGGRIGFEDGTSCFEKGKKMINTGNIPEGAAKRNFINFANKAMEIGKQSGRGLRTITKFGVLPEMIIIGADTLIRTGMGDTLDEAFKRASDIYRTDKAYEQADASEINRRMNSNDGELILNLRKFNNEKAKLSSLEQQKEADLALAGDDFAETNIGMTEDEIEQFYAPKIQEQENNLFNASISDAEERAGLAKEMEFADKKGVDYKKSPVGAFFDYLGEKPGFKQAVDLFATEARGEPDVSAQTLENYLSGKIPQEEEKELRNIINQDKAKGVLDAIKKIESAQQVPEGEIREPNIFDEERNILFELAKTDPALAERLFGPSMTFAGDPIKQTDLQDEMNLDRGIYALGGRIGFADGPMDPRRRTFMKIMAGIMSIPIVGKFFKPAAKVVPVVQDGVKLGVDKLMLLVNKIRNLGTDVSPKLSTKERERVLTYEGKDGSEYELYEDLTTGDIRVERNKTGVGSYGGKTYDTIEDKTTFEIKKGQPDETTKGKTPPDEYEEGKAVFDQDGTVADFDEVDDSTIKAIEDEIN
jgi:hypothetical protein